MEALYVIVPVLGLIGWLTLASLRHERRRLAEIRERMRTLSTSTPEQRAREAYDDLSTEW